MYSSRLSDIARGLSFAFCQCFTLSTAAARASNEPVDLLKVNEAERVRLSAIIRQQLLIDISNEPIKSAPVVAMVNIAACVVILYLHQCLPISLSAYFVVCLFLSVAVPYISLVLLLSWCVFGLFGCVTWPVQAEIVDAAPTTHASGSARLRVPWVFLSLQCSQRQTNARCCKARCCKAHCARLTVQILAAAMLAAARLTAARLVETDKCSLLQCSLCNARCANTRCCKVLQGSLCVNSLCVAAACELLG